MIKKRIIFKYHNVKDIIYIMLFLIIDNQQIIVYTLRRR